MNAIDEVLFFGSLNQASKAMILLHGRGGAANDILNLVDRFCDDNFYIAAPQALHNSWYPYGFMTEKANEPFLSKSIQAIEELIDQIAKQIPKNQIYLLGFSQGACLALEVSARFATKYGGVVAFTGGLIGSNINEEKYQGDFESTPVFISNGDNDPHIPLARSEQSKKLLEKMHANVTLKVYKNRPHTITEDEITFVQNSIFL